ncbi:uncharacterized protein EAE97_004422 [Botrytis byssoidea]|uniref:HPt domain-containing protein n=1 Tax=Botrytis byssoidea TaxID=139641 RepID=A0A9P5IU03_9HELO|nr:uncharacterized protein EAE97_004422 [Botrytis byssoidea]KAF7947173.1 hypothetical protein EAE97_004422 [Botrytis byssoidea]
MSSSTATPTPTPAPKTVPVAAPKPEPVKEKSPVPVIPPPKEVVVEEQDDERNETDFSAKQSDDGSVGLPDLGENIDAATFEQILEMDDDEEEREFSSSIVFGFFEQAEQTFVKMDDALKEKDLATLSSLGHFLKGSSATLGLTKVKDSCEKIQHYGQQKDEAGTTDEPDKEKCLARIKETLVSVKEEYKEVEKVLKKFYAT